MVDVVAKSRVQVPETYGAKEFGGDTKQIIQNYVNALMSGHRNAGRADESTREIMGKLQTPSGLESKPMREMVQPDFGGPSPHLQYPYPKIPGR